MKASHPRKNGKTIRLEISEEGGEISAREAETMRIRCEAFLHKRDPFWRDPGTFCFGTIGSRRKAA